ncbi:hypothetical protein T492DRAFT_837043 [Pavlovales sp. CCMP2436]|nr:hypothetical protein T492DRAFT_837043 [Pavlovales sp. CCMP2436]
MTKAKPKAVVVKTQEEIEAGKNPIRVWTYTINNYIEEELAFVKLLVEPSEVKRHVCGIEVGEGGTPHLQGAISWACGKRFTPMKKLFPRARLAKASTRARNAGVDWIELYWDDKCHAARPSHQDGFFHRNQEDRLRQQRHVSYSFISELLCAQ